MLSFISGLSLEYIFVALLVVVAFLLIVLLIIQIRTHKQIKSISYPAYNYILNKAQSKAGQIIGDATKNARKMRVDAELAGIKAVAKKKLKSQKIEKEYQQALEELTQDTRHLLDTRTQELEEKYNQLISGFEENLKQESEFIEKKMTKNVQQIEEVNESVQKRVIELNDKYNNFISDFENKLDSQIKQTGVSLQQETDDLNQKISSIMENVEKNIQESENKYSNLLSSLEKRAKRNLSKYEKDLSQTVEKIGGELDNFGSNLAREIKQEINSHLTQRFQEANEVIDTYRKERIKLINEQIIVLVERATQIALHKKLSVQDQTDLIYQALEEAKKEGILK